MAKTLRFRRRDWLEPSLAKLPSDINVDEIGNVLNIRPLIIDLDIILPDDADVKVAEKALLLAGNRAGAAMREKFATMINAVMDAFAAEKQHDPKAYKDASSAVDTFNKQAEDFVEGLRDSLCDSIGKALGRRGNLDGFGTRGNEQFFKVRIVSGAFGTEDGDGTDPEEVDIDHLLRSRKGKWLHCAAVWGDSNSVIVGVDAKKPIKKRSKEHRKYLNALPDGVRRSAKSLFGIVMPKSATTLIFNFVTGPKLTVEALKSGLKKQLGRGVNLSKKSVQFDVDPARITKIAESLTEEEWEKEGSRTISGKTFWIDEELKKDAPRLKKAIEDAGGKLATTRAAKVDYAISRRKKDELDEQFVGPRTQVIAPDKLNEILNK